MTIEHSPESEGSTRFRPAKVKLDQEGLGSGDCRSAGFRAVFNGVTGGKLPTDHDGHHRTKSSVRGQGSKLGLENVQ